VRMGLSISIKVEKFIRYYSEIERVERSIEIKAEEYLEDALSKRRES
jgi:hypothetical protein